MFPTNDNSVNNAALSCWAGEVAADTIAGRQTTGALLDWPSKALCPAPRLVVHSAVNIGDQWYQLKSVVGRDLSFERTSCFQSNGLFAFITDDTGVLKILFAACNAKPLQMQCSKSKSNG